MTDSPRRAEIWLVKLDPTVGAEIQKTRPAVVVSSDRLQNLPIRLIVPFTSWQPRFTTHTNKVAVRASTANGLNRDSAADVLQLRSAALDRFEAKLGALDAADLSRIIAKLVITLDYEPA